MRLIRRSSGRVVAVAVTLAVTAACSSGSSPTTTSSTVPPTSTTAAPTTTTITPTTSSTTSTTTTTVTTTTSTATTTTTVPPPTTSPVPTDAATLAGQRTLCTFAGTRVPEDLLQRLASGATAGVVVFKANLPSNEVAVANATAIQQAAHAVPGAPPAIVAADQEGGRVTRIPGPPTEAAATLGARSVDEIRAQAQAAAENLLSWGIDLDLAPVADVARPGTFIERQERSFGSDPALVTGAVEAFVSGLHAGGVPATLKHFPGLGAASANTDDAAAAVDVSEDALRSVDLVPFAAGIGAGADLVMISSARYPALASEPAVLSRRIVTDLLRGELAFDGVTISDALDAAGAPPGALADVAVAAAAAGVDLLIATDPTACVTMASAVQAGIEDGRIPLAEAQASYARVMALRGRLRG